VSSSGKAVSRGASRENIEFFKICRNPFSIRFVVRRVMNPTILLLGRTGQVGSELACLLPQFGKVIAPERADLDLSKTADIRKTIEHVRPRFIVNAAAYTAVDQAEKDEATARLINSDAPATIAEEARKLGATLIHYSTDYVFDGRKGSP
jgi:dTDP-4-dehydrorhamnose reductase